VELPGLLHLVAELERLHDVAERQNDFVVCDFSVFSVMFLYSW
jgi:hypothetical protein